MLPSINTRALSAVLGFPLVMLFCLVLSGFVIIGFISANVKVSVRFIDRVTALHFCNSFDFLRSLPDLLIWFFEAMNFLRRSLFFRYQKVNLA